MRNILISSARLAMIASAALVVTACGDSGETTNNAADETLDSNMMLDTLGNDASALETVGNASETLPPMETGNQVSNSTDVLGNTSGGDTGGNSVDSNVAGM